MKNTKKSVIRALENEEQKYYLGPAGWGTALCSAYHKAAYWVRQMPEETTPEQIRSLFDTIHHEDFILVKATIESTLEAL